MNLKASSQTPGSFAVKRGQRREGIALVLVLSFLVILSALILTFFTSVSTERASAAAYSQGTAAKMLADSALHLAEGQIRDATQGSDDPADPSSIVAWASQPGMIRTFDTAGRPKKIYKLYTSDQMVVPATGFISDSRTLPSDWNTGANKELYTDLNAPEVHTYAGDGAGSAGTPREHLVYPIVDPTAEKAETGGIKVKGFSIKSAPGYQSGTDASAINNPAPMPVKWLYVLQNGEIVAPTAPDPETVLVKGATLENPVTGRIAFWTDDETAKVNINTASEGVYWDVPRVYSVEDFGLYSGGTTINQPGYSITQPAQGEFQRYPGHPATTSLSPIFGEILKVPPGRPRTAADASLFSAYYNMIPRVAVGGSLAGTRRAPGVLTPDTDRLYASIDELMFSQTLTGGKRVPNTATGGSADPRLITRQVLEQAKFFVTASSSAPETTLYNTPRIAMWPVARDETKRMGYDKLAAFCASVGTKPGEKEFYFTRQNPRSLTQDFTLSPRNQKLYAYLQALTSRNVPGFGGNFQTKYPGLERDQILTYIYDYIRITNSQDRSSVPGRTAQSYTPAFLSGDPGSPAGEILPIRIGQTQGFGRFYSVSEGTLLFYGTAAVNGRTTKMRAVFLTDFVSPAHGMGAVRNWMRYTVTGLDNLEVRFGPDGQWMNLGFKPTGTNSMEASDLNSYHGRSVGGTESPYQAFAGKQLNSAGGNAANNYPFFGTEITLPAVPAGGTPFQTFAFRMVTGSEVKIEIRPKDAQTQLVQTLHMKFPMIEAALKVPGLATNFPGLQPPGNRINGTFSVVQPTDTVVSLEVAGSAGNSADAEFDNTSGDSRLTAGLIDVPESRFRPHKDFMGVLPTGTQFAHGLLAAAGSDYSNLTNTYRGATHGYLAKGVATNGYRQDGTYIDRSPDVPSRMKQGAGALRAVNSGSGPGDWDTGFGDQKDGAYINKPDEGDTNLDDTNGNGQRLPYLLGFGQGYAAAQNTFFSPNRQVSSPLMFGSIPTGVQRGLPWQTLLFHSRPEDLSHPGRVSPPDHLLADLFWMPVIEPYAISQPFSTAGKINMNYQIEPFDYIRRDTGLQAVMKSTKFLALEPTSSKRYKPIDPGNSGTRVPVERKSINPDTTLAAFDAKFASNEIFRSATQICEMDLLPPGESSVTIPVFWNKNTLTGDNLREKPYADIYPRLTTKSNTYTIHVRVQALKKATGTPPDQWKPGRDAVLSEYRGSSLVERYIDVNDPRLPDFASLAVQNPSAPELNIDQYYKLRVISTKRFSP